eukprot:TRINITY_DN23675_c0_g1_i1.p1 TRINITY_DN23675_c0_g1~~TRINITY_DN23675_c0_g1_i1.p1  ORF type:complete len:456 (+),score=55.26 TRINITY_DN23675_c0_g1_i1:91-1458(+)
MAPPIWVQLLGGLALTAVPSGTGEEQSLDGAYMIINRASGRRLASGPSGFSALSGGLAMAVEQGHRWRFVPQTNETYAIVNHANGMRIFAQAGKDDADGFLTTDQGPVYQDQTWMPLAQNDGSLVLANYRSGRVITANVGFDGAAGFGAIRRLDDRPFYADQRWWLIDPDQGDANLQFPCSHMQDEVQALRAVHQTTVVALQDEQSARARCLAEKERRGQFDGMRAADAPQVSHPGTSYGWLLLGGAISTIASLLFTSLFVARRLFCGRVVCPSAQVLEEEPQLDAGIYFAIFCSQADGADVRVIKIQCPGVEHSGIEVDLICNGCEVSIRREASLGVDALSWTKRFHFAAEEGCFEFREDRMQLEHGFLQLTFEARSLPARRVRFPQHYSLAVADGGLLWDETSTSAESIDAAPSSPARSLQLLRSPSSSKKTGGDIVNDESHQDRLGLAAGGA